MVAGWAIRALGAVGLAWVVGAACSSGDNKRVDAAVRDADAAVEDADAAVPPGGWPAPSPPTCPNAVTGVGAIWLDDPEDLTLVERPLYCLAGDGRLHGPWVEEIATVGWEAAHEQEDRFIFPMDDDHFHEVQAYFIVVGMAGTYQPQYPRAEMKPIKISISKTEHIATARIAAGVVYIGTMGAAPRALTLTLLSHEYGHHLVMQLAPGIVTVLNEALADYLAADYTGKEKILSLDRVEVPEVVRNDAQLMTAAATYFERSVANQLHYPEDMRTKGELCAFQKEAVDKLPPGSGLILGDKLEECAKMSAAELAEPEPHLTGRIVVGALWDLRGEIGAQKMNQLIFETLAAQRTVSDFLAFGEGLAETDRELFGGEHTAAIARVFAAHGLTPDAVRPDAGPFADLGSDASPGGPVNGTVSAGAGVACGATTADDCKGLLMVVAADAPEAPPASTVLASVTIRSADLSGGNTAPYEFVDLPVGAKVWITAVLSEDGSEPLSGPKSGDLVATDTWKPPGGLTVPAGSGATVDVVLDTRLP